MIEADAESAGVLNSLAYYNGLHNPTATWGSSRVSPLLGDELPMPTKDGVGSNQRSNFGQHASPDGLAAHSEPATLIIGQPESSSTELLFEDEVLLSEILDDRILLTADPAGQGSNKDLPGLKDGGYRRIVVLPRIIRQLSLAA